MIGCFMELDGTTLHRDIPDMRPNPILHMPVFSRFSVWDQFPLNKPVMTEKRYRLMHYDGKVAFYERIADVEEIR